MTLSRGNGNNSGDNVIVKAVRLVGETEDGWIKSVYRVDFVADRCDLCGAPCVSYLQVVVRT